MCQRRRVSEDQAGVQWCALTGRSHVCLLSNGVWRHCRCSHGAVRLLISSGGAVHAVTFFMEQASLVVAKQAPLHSVNSTLFKAAEAEVSAQSGRTDQINLCSCHFFRQPRSNVCMLLPFWLAKFLWTDDSSMHQTGLSRAASSPGLVLHFYSERKSRVMTRHCG